MEKTGKIHEMEKISSTALISTAATPVPNFCMGVFALFTFVILMVCALIYSTPLFLMANSTSLRLPWITTRLTMKIATEIVEPYPLLLCSKDTLYP